MDRSNLKFKSLAQSNLKFKLIVMIIICCILLGIYQSCTASNRVPGETVHVWMTTPDQAHLLERQENISFFTNTPTNNPTITVDETQTYQQMDGFGASFTDSSAWLIHNKMSASQRDTLMTRLFDYSHGIGLSFLRQPMGASDLTLPSVGEYSYDEMPAGKTDPQLKHFSISHDTATIIPLLKQAQQINPRLKIMATPWSPPGWMKSSHSMEKGSLNSSAYATYANYFVKFIQAYQAQGLPIYAITPQNEPLYTPDGYPGMSMNPDEQTNFIKNNLGPAFAHNHISTRILTYDHNWDKPEYPDSVLSDATAASYTAGTAFHCYGGNASAQTTRHNAYPTKDIYETECSGSTGEGSPNWPNSFKNILKLIIHATRNWSKTVVRWGLALDLNGQPHLETGDSCTRCRGVVSVDQRTGNVTYNSDYYGFGQISKFVAPGAHRIFSNSFGSGNIEDVAFRNPDGSKVLLVYNGSSSNTPINVKWGNETLSYTIPAGAAATFTWSGHQIHNAVTTTSGESSFISRSAS